MITSKNNSILLTILAIIVVCFFFTAQFSWRGPDRKGYTKIIQSDGKGYYMYLPNIFINRNIASQTPDERFILKTEHGAVNKYFSGTAVAMLPFFGGGYVSAWIFNKPLSGYSAPFQKGVSFAALFYLCFGLIFLAGLLLLYDIKPLPICISLLVIVFGTNLLMYTVYHPAFSHVYSFCFISMFLYYAKKCVDGATVKQVLLLGFSFGMVLIIRPTNGIIILLLPFIAGSTDALKNMFRQFRNTRLFFAFIIPLLAVLSIQVILWYIQTGELFVQSYMNEGFYFLHPEIWNVLFSFRKGFFIYTPLAFISLYGLVIVFRKNRFKFYWLLIFLLVMIYLTSSWWNWYYGPSYGQRPFIDFYGVFALLFAFLLNNIKADKPQKIFLSTIILLSSFNLLQSYQYLKNIISPWDMNFEKYRYTFFRTSPAYYSCLGGCNDILPYSKKQTLLFEQQNDFEKKYPDWRFHETKDLGGDKKNVCDYPGKEFNAALELKVDSSLTTHRLLYMEIQLDRMETIPSGKTGPLVAVAMLDGQQKNYFYTTFQINEIPNKTANTWRTFKYTLEIPAVKNAGDELNVQVWNKNHSQFYLDNFKVKIYGID